ncbi:MAG: hypothetical protein AAF447_11865 [Myxococcota bacterium]
MPIKPARRGMASAALGALLLVASNGAAQPTAISARFDVPEELRVGDRRAVVLVVAGVEAGLPVLITTAEEGTAIEVVRGRLTRLDAETPDAEPLRFPIPLVARAPGTSVLRAELRTFACAGSAPDAPCDEVVTTATLTLTVARAR